MTLQPNGAPACDPQAPEVDLDIVRGAERASGVTSGVVRIAEETPVITWARLVVGIDLGLDGALVAVDAHRRLVLARRASDAYTVVVKATRRDYVPGSMRDLLRDLAPALVVVELAGTRPGEGAVGARTVGRAQGLWEGLCCGLGIPLRVVAPATWHTSLRGVPGDDAKGRAILRAQQALPDLRLVPPRGRKPHTGLADAACLALWGVEDLAGEHARRSGKGGGR